MRRGENSSSPCWPNRRVDLRTTVRVTRGINAFDDEPLECELTRSGREPIAVNPGSTASRIPAAVVLLLTGRRSPDTVRRGVEALATAPGAVGPATYPDGVDPSFDAGRTS